MKKHRYIDTRLRRPVIAPPKQAVDVRVKTITEGWLNSEPLPFLDRWLGKHRDELAREGCPLDTPTFLAVMQRIATLWRDAALSALPVEMKLDTEESVAAANATIAETLPSIEKFRNAAKRLFARKAPEINPEQFFEDALSSGNPALIAAAFGIPHWFVPALINRAARSKISFPSLCMGLVRSDTPPPVFARVNKIDELPAILADLKQAEFKVQVDEDLLTIEGHRPLFSTLSYKKNLFEIQDRSSVRIGRACGVTPGKLVLDLCAGNGGKTLHIASQLGGKGAVVAADLDERKLQALKLRARHAGLADVVRTVAHDATAKLPLPREAGLRGGFDIVLVDAPCSSSGTWRRNPDVVLRLDPEALPAMPLLQQKIIDAAARTVRQGGRLVYATCSFMPAENEEVVAAFLSAHDDFSLVNEELFGLDGSGDIMYCAVLERKAG